MNKKHTIPCLAALLLSATATFGQTTLAKWTFESLTFTAPSPYTNYSNGKVFTNILAEVGTGTASGYHFGWGTSSFFSTVTGNGSSKALTSAGWTNAPATPGDYYQFATTTLGYQNIGISFDQISSGTGPGRFFLSYSTDGVNFTQFGDIYNVTNAPSWNVTTPTTLNSYSFDLSSVAAITNQSVVYFRLTVTNNTSASGALIGTGGTCRIDNVAIVGANPGLPMVAPASQTNTVNFGDNVTLSVAANGTTPLSYQWYFNDLNTPLSDGNSTYGTISGTTNQSLALTFVSSAQAGTYYIVVTNPLGSATGQVSLIVKSQTPIVTNIAYLHTLHNANYVLTDTTNLYQIDGIVTTPANLVQPLPAQSFFIQDSSGAGMDVFFRGGFPFPSQGDHVTVVAPLLQFNGVLEAAPVNGNPAHSITIVNSGNPLPTPRLLDFSSPISADAWEGYVHAGTNVPALEGSLVVISNVFMALPDGSSLMTAGGSIFLTNLTGQTFTMTVPNNALLQPVGYPLPGNFATSIQGVVSQAQTSGTVLTNGYTVYLTLLSDIVAGTPPVLPTPVNFSSDGTNLVMVWTDATFTLQSSTNIAGPYTDVSGATSPYTNAFNSAPAQFFRLYHP